jgi:heterotetrameric sarcosine oxidase alpha subunit
MSGYRLALGGALLDRSQPLGFRFDGRAFAGFAGDTLASALLANGTRLVGRSFKYHRPRGLVACGPEEPNALVTLREDARREPNTCATMVELFDGLVAQSQNRWPSLRFDAMAASGLLAPLLGAGFYYKTFKGPTAKSWMLYERFIRRAAGLGRGTFEPDPDRYEKASLFSDVLVVGSGPSGIMAALTAARAGARVVLADEKAWPGGTLLGERRPIDGIEGDLWVRERLAELAAFPDATLLPRTTVWGYYDGNALAAVERVADHLPVPPAGMPRQRQWTIRARRVVLATGALERPLVFAGNDLSGVMLADAVRRYARLWGVAAGRRAVLFTNNDSAYDAVLELVALGVSVVALVDARPAPPATLAREVERRGIRLHPGSVVARADGGRTLRRVEIRGWDAAAGRLAATGETVEADVLGVSGGWSPVIHLASQAGGAPVWDEALAAFLPGPPHRPWGACGAAAGRFGLAEALADGAAAGAAAARELGFEPPAFPPPRVEPEPAGVPLLPLWEVPTPEGRNGKKFVDLQNDVTAEDVRLARREGFEAVEHLKRYTTLGMATDQGKTSNVVGLAIMAEARGVPIAEAGTTRFRPPYTPVSLGALAGREVGPHFKPERRTPMHDWHVAHGAEMQAAGLWLRPRAYLLPGETVAEAYVREARAVRRSVGIVDVSTLGKIDVQGPDAAAFLDRVYVNNFASLPVGRARYGVMLREDGIVLDDGTSWRLGETRFLMTTSTANAAAVLSHLEFLLAAVWPELRVQVTSVTDQWAAMAVAGPESRRVLAAALKGIDFADDAFPHMGVRDGRCGEVPVLVARLSFSGERAYEVFSGARSGEAVWRRIIEAGLPFGIMPYGVEALGTLRIEKGHVAGPEIDGRTTLDDLGLARLASPRKHYVGRAMMERPGLVDPSRPKLVGLISKNGEPVRAGAHLVASADPAAPGRSLGHVTSWTYSPALERHVALGLLEGGLGAADRSFWATYPLKGWHVPVEVTAPCLVDPAGARLHA